MDGAPRPGKPLGTVFRPGSFGRFLLVGGVNTAVGFGCFPLLYVLLGSRVGYLPILVFCTVFNPCFAFLTHKYLTFQATGPGERELARYLLFAVASFLVSWAFLASIDGWTRGWFLLAQFGFNAALTATSFVVARYFVFAASAVTIGPVAPVGTLQEPAGRSGHHPRQGSD